MIIDILGPSLEDLFNFCGRQLSLKTTLMLVIQLVERFKYIHEKTFVHRDIKPDNFLMGLRETSHVAYIVDYGLAKRYYDPRTGAHIPYRNDKSLTGTARYASIHAHLGEELARRDDKGVLPWQNLPAFTRSEKYKRIKETKIATTLEDLCVGCPPEFLKYMTHCRTLQFEEKPDYQMLVDLLKGLGEREGLNLDIHTYDWIAKCNKLPKRNPSIKEEKPPVAENEQNVITGVVEGVAIAVVAPEKELPKLNDLNESSNKLQEEIKHEAAEPSLGADVEASKPTPKEEAKKDDEFQFASFDEVQRMVMGDQVDPERGGFMQNFVNHYQLFILSIGGPIP